ncbi:MAG: sulfotransferase, partial [Chitinophagales bacterium]|nr:sulfotransferase [Chitinophagales bacterium]
MKIKSEPLLIVGTQRSGSNLLRLMLNQLPEIDAPHPPHLLTVFTPLLPIYGNLNIADNFKTLVQDVVAYISVNPVPWFGVSLNAGEVMDRALGNTLAEVFRVVYEIKADAKNARYWCCKSMSNIYYLNQIEGAGIQPFYIHLLRDGRDVAASFKNAIVGEKHIYFIAQQWKKDQEICAALQAKTDPSRFVLIRYE